jgi:hypothetical protein
MIIPNTRAVLDKEITQLLQGFEILMAVTMKTVFWNMMPCSLEAHVAPFSGYKTLPLFYR